MVPFLEWLEKGIFVCHLQIIYVLTGDAYFLSVPSVFALDIT